jgi:hypothetical protein
MVRPLLECDGDQEAGEMFSARLSSRAKLSGAAI